MTPVASPNAPVQMQVADWLELQRLLARIAPGWQVLAFGSRARFQAKPHSDLDLAIVAPQALSLAEMADLKDLFGASDLTFKVDVLDMAAATPAMRDEVMKAVVVLRGVQGGLSSPLPSGVAPRGP